MSNSKQLIIWLTREELKILVYSLSSTQPISLEMEPEQYKLYHKLLAKLNEVE